MRRPTDLGTLFDTLAERRGGTGTTVHLSRPFDITPGSSAVRYGIGELASLVREAAGWLAAAGAGPGDTVAVVKPNHWDYALLACAAARLGAVPALLSDHLAPEALRTLLARLKPAVLVTDARHADPATATLAARTVSLDGPAPGALTLSELRGAAPPPPRPGRDAQRTLLITHTSGTTGLPKLVEHTAETILERLAAFEATRMPVVTSRRRDTVANANPFCHGRAVPWTVSVLHLAPRELVILADSEPETARRVLAPHPPTLVEAAPATYVRWRELLPDQADQADQAGAEGVFRDVRLYISTFDAMHPPTVRAFLNASRRRHPLWIQAWGQTETGPLTFRPLTRRAVAEAGGRHPTTRNVGWPVPGRTRLRVVDPETFRPLAPGRAGLVLVRTRARCAGYTGEPERWAAGAREDGWWNTGDLGALTRSGALVLLDREVDSVPGLSCVELEDVLEDRLPQIVEATVLSVRGGPPRPVLVTGDGRRPEPAAWAKATEDLPPLAEPVVMPWDELPRTGTGKVRRHLLRALLRDRTDPPVSARGHGTGR